MATGVKPRDEESSLTRADLEAIQDAMKNKKFRDLLSEYCDEVRDPANQAIYQKEMTQLEKERGYDVTFINPKGGYVIKTSVAGERKAFINICSNENVDKPSCTVQERNGQKGMNWQLPYTIIPPREDFNHKRERCIIYDVVFHPDTLRMAEVNKRFRELVNNTAFDGLQKTYGIHFDSNNCRFPKACYKGMTTPAVIRKEDPNYKPPTDEENQELTPEVLEKLYPQHIYQENKEHLQENVTYNIQHRKKAKNSKKEFTHSSDKGYTVPKYVIKQQQNVDFQDFTYHKDSKQYSAIPSNLTIEINLPLLSSTKDCVLDVREKNLTLISEKPAKYKLNLDLPYSVNDECGNATFDKSKHMLIVSLPVIRKKLSSNKITCQKSDSGVESEENSNSDEESSRKNNLVEEITLTSENPDLSSIQEKETSPIVDEEFLLSNIGYTFPSYTYNALDDIVAFTFHVKNTETDSVKVKNVENKVYIKFTSIGSGFVPIHYAAFIVFDHDINFENAVGEAWDNNVILQLETGGNIPEKFQIGLQGDLKMEYFDVSKLKKPLKEHIIQNNIKSSEEVSSSPVVEVTNLGSETNIVVSSTSHNANKEDENERDIVWTENGTFENGAKSILRKPIAMMRSFSESSCGDVASSMDYISSDCIPEESSLKKTVRFSDVIARQFYRYNSSIEGQKRKNQRKKSKKRNLERRRSESEAEDDSVNAHQTSRSRLKSALKQRHDSGVVDTSDAEECKYVMSDCDLQYDSNTDENANKNDETNINKDSSILNIIDRNGNTKENQPEIWKSAPIPHSTKMDNNIQNNQTKVTCSTIKHNTDLYNPDRLNKGKYLEIKFKNDLIFDLDM
ncbi:protein kintoun [Nymphalis io]|uniref:protein kintoun n=1 Tax=Inachis io TaxID=171585 RepID=UPI002169D39A|nr:protein kintoun [Nymphalis io]